MNIKYNITIYSENNAGLLNRITGIFTRRLLNIESITTSSSETPGVHRYTILVETNKEVVRKIVGQIEKQIEVIKAFAHKNEHVIHREIALYKVLKEKGTTDLLLTKLSSNAILIEENNHFFVIQSTNTVEKNDALLDEMKKFNLLEFSRSGQISLNREVEKIQKVHIEEKIKITTNN